MKLWRMEQGSEHKKIIISGGGTGGHVFPAIAIADALSAGLKDPEILFVGALGRMEMDRVPKAGYTIIGLPVEGIRRKLSLSNIKVVFRLLKSLWMAGRIIRDFSPDVVVGVGGYASGPVLRKAASRGIPTLIQEQNSYAGVTNRLLARRAKKICVAYEGMEKYFPADKLVLTGNPVRQEIRKLSGKISTETRKTARSFFGFGEDDRILLVLGGSLGARTINESVKAGLDLFRSAGLKLIWQCGKYYYESLKPLVSDIPPEEVLLKDFIQEMDQAYLAADLIISRAGALSISELCIAGKPAVLVPSPNVAEDHQTKNASALVNRQAALMVADADAREVLAKKVLELLEDEKKRSELSANITELAKPGSTEEIAREVMDLMNEA